MKSLVQATLIGALVAGVGMTAWAQGAVSVATTSAQLGASLEKSKTAASAKAEHMRALDLALKGENGAALKLLERLAASDLPSNEQDRVWLSIGRIQYQSGAFKEAIAAYSKVRKHSSSWIESLEERAWAYLQLDQPNEALAQLNTVTSPLFKERNISEPYLASALAQLRICDFKALFKTLDLFKERFRDRAKTWEASTDPIAKARLRDLSDTIQKLNVVEAEAIQRLYMQDEELKRNKGSAPKIAKNPRDLSFPSVEGDEVWLDEVDDFRVSVKGCPQKGRSL